MFGLSNSALEAIIQLFSFLLPKDHCVPDTLEKVQKVVHDLGLDYQKIHACINDCVLFRKEYAELDTCPTCGESRWKTYIWFRWKGGVEFIKEVYLEAIKKELAKLLVAGIIKEVYHPEWLPNLVLVRKKNNNEWRMFVDYTDLNKHCLEDPFGLPTIDQVIDSTAGCTLLSFLDCYSGYHQIALKEEDQIKTAFITPYGTYYYKTMSFGLKKTK